MCLLSGVCLEFERRQLVYQVWVGIGKEIFSLALIGALTLYSDKEVLVMLGTTSTFVLTKIWEELARQMGQIGEYGSPGCKNISSATSSGRVQKKVVSTK